MEMRRATLLIDAANGERQYALTPGKTTFFDELYVDFQCAPEQGGMRYSVFLHPKQDVTVRRLELQFHLPAGQAARFFANGFQSASESRILPFGSTMPPLRKIARPFLSGQGDDHLNGVRPGPGEVHSWTWTCLDFSNGEALLAGSLSERTGFTLFIYDWASEMLCVRKDMEALPLAHSFPGLDFWVSRGRVPAIFDRYAELYGRGQPSPGVDQAAQLPFLGWSTPPPSSRHRLSTQQVVDTAQALAGSGLPFRYLLINNGWQAVLGDWRSVHASFQRGMGIMAEAVRGQGMKPALWLAPLVAAAGSELVRGHPDWLLKDDRRRPVPAFWHPAKQQRVFALDFYHPGVQEYLSGVFHVVLEQWGYACLKLDLLYAACLRPPFGKTRGQVMGDVLEFLRRQVGRSELWAAAVPLGAALDGVEHCQVSTGFSPLWENRLSAFLHHRERTATRVSLHALLTRWALHKRFFLSAGCGFTLRPPQGPFDMARQNTALIIQTLLSGLMLTEDNVQAYSPEQYAELEDALAWRGSRVLRVIAVMDDVFQIDFEHSGQNYSAFCNLGARARKCPLPANEWLQLEPFETLILSVDRLLSSS